MTFEDKRKRTHKEMTENSDASSKKIEVGIETRAQQLLRWATVWPQ